MNKNIIKMITITLFIGASTGCSFLVTDNMIKSIYQKMDINHDGYINYSEYLKDASSNKSIAKEAKEKGMTEDEYMKWDFNRADANKDGKITEQELIDLARKEL